ncbi:MAG: hypothetical protein AB1458_16825 [Bacteroidota bacterium]
MKMGLYSHQTVRNYRCELKKHIRKNITSQARFDQGSFSMQWTYERF